MFFIIFFATFFGFISGYATIFAFKMFLADYIKQYFSYKKLKGQNVLRDIDFDFWNL